jgi:hypothetical protein
LFSFVPKKFFTIRTNYKNIKGTSNKETPMLTEITEILKQSRVSIVFDAIGMVSLFVLLFAGLNLSGAL